MKKVPKSLKVKTSETQWLQTKILQLQVMSLHPSRRNSQKLYNQPTQNALFYFSVGYHRISRCELPYRARWVLWHDQNPIWASFLTGRPWVAILERFLVGSCDIEVDHVTLMTSDFDGGGPGGLFFPAHQKLIQICPFQITRSEFTTSKKGSRDTKNGHVTWKMSRDESCDTFGRLMWF